VRDVKAQRIQCDEIWSLVAVNRKIAPRASEQLTRPQAIAGPGKALRRAASLTRSGPPLQPFRLRRRSEREDQRQPRSALDQHVVHGGANPTTRMSRRRFTRLTNAFSKKLGNHAHMVALYALWYNFVRVHKTLRVSPAMAAGIETRLWSMEDVVAMIDEQAERRAPRLADRLVG